MSTHDASTRRILITGASGLLGSNLAAAYRAKGIPIVALGGVADGDLRDPEIVDALMARHAPDVLIHCAALTDVDYCESHAAEAWASNVETTRLLAERCAKDGTRFVYISTDSVFDGSRGDWSEHDAPAPKNAYARSKREGEKAVLRECPEALIIRTNIYGWNSHSRTGKRQSLAEWILDRLNAGREVPAFTDVLFSPILVNHLAEPVLELLRGGREGIFHVAGAWSGSKYDFAVRLAETFGFRGSGILPACVAGAKLKAPRPLNTTLNIDKASRVLQAPLPDLEHGLQQFRALRAARELTHA